MKMNYFDQISFTRVDQALHMIYSGDKTLTFDLRRLDTSDKRDSRRLGYMFITAMHEAILHRMEDQVDKWDNISSKDKAFVLAFSVIGRNPGEFNLIDSMYNAMRGTESSPAYKQAVKEFKENEYCKEYYEGVSTKEALLHIFNQAFGHFASLCIECTESARPIYARMFSYPAWRNCYSDLKYLAGDVTKMKVPFIKMDGYETRTKDAVKKFLENTLLNHGFSYSDTYSFKHYYGDSGGLCTLGNTDFDNVCWRFKSYSRHSTEVQYFDVRIGNSGMSATVAEMQKMMKNLTASAIEDTRIKEYIHQCRMEYDATYIGGGK